ncbi:Flagellar basal body rod protein FlgB [Aquicella siphonis]|uniref:Flagellar basal body rod protein FlgB n=1 Tax=Aquicella siphonis TaxID=254247 RepID=A0A5E4PKM2_9COXI|nr:flagellar basal body rod protein FlgB [Aquicella siphonis]VVC77095.1 Flagellar basal body rod protein FlgB [Aquicella siphonis]
MADSIFGVSEKALQLTEERSVMLTNNLVNSSTPHYKARDIDFHQALQDANQAYSLNRTNPNHIEPENQVSGQPILYRVPMQMSLDGNTVDDEIERKNFIENALRYQVSLTFVQNKSDELMKAIKGE